MTAKERIQAVVSKKTPDQVPFVYFSDLIPQGAFERKLRDRGAGLIVNTSAVDTVIRDTECISVEKAGVRTQSFVTPHGTVSASFVNGRYDISSSGAVQREYLLKDAKDYKALQWIKEHTEFTLNLEALAHAETVLGEDGVTHAWSDEPPYMGLQYDMGYMDWCLQQEDNPKEFCALMEAHGEMQKRRLALLAKSPQKLINIGNLSGNFSSAKYKVHMLPYFEWAAALLKNAGKYTTIHADALNLAAFAGITPGEGIDIMEAVTPPPVGDLSLSAARKLWGEKTTIWVNFPETVFYEGYDATLDYTRKLLQEDACPNKLISFTEVGLLGARGERLHLFMQGIEAVAEAIDRWGTY